MCEYVRCWREEKSWLHLIQTAQGWYIPETNTEQEGIQTLLISIELSSELVRACSNKDITGSNDCCLMSMDMLKKIGQDRYMRAAITKSNRMNNRLRFDNFWAGDSLTAPNSPSLFNMLRQLRGINSLIV